MPSSLLLSPLIALPSPATLIYAIEGGARSDGDGEFGSKESSETIFAFLMQCCSSKKSDTLFWHHNRLIHRFFPRQLCRNGAGCRALSDPAGVQDCAWPKPDKKHFLNNDNYRKAELSDTHGCQKGRASWSAWPSGAVTDAIESVC